MRQLRIVAPPDGAVERRPVERLTVHLKNGESHSAEVTHARRISSREELEAKFFTCVEGSLTGEVARQTRDLFLGLDKVADITKLTDLVRGNEK
jgi:hypothetical protein